MNARLKLVLILLSALVWSLGHAQGSSPIQGRYCGSSLKNFGLAVPANVCVQFNVAYGSDPLQRFDVYIPSQAHNAPVILMVHGGAWQSGDKFSPSVVQNKLSYWTPSGVILISTNYPLLPKANPLQQAQSVAQALAYAQRHASEWGGDPRKFILMGHSSGAHLVALLSAEPSLAKAMGAQPWLGTVGLDSAAYDVPAIMKNPYHAVLYDQAFGASAGFWNASSPVLQLHSRIVPFLAVCSLQRAGSCPQAQEFVGKARRLGSQASVLQEKISHEQIDANLGVPSGYTSQVNAFMAALNTGALH